MMQWLSDLMDFLMGARPSPPPKEQPVPYKCPCCGGGMHVVTGGIQCDNGICTAGYRWEDLTTGTTMAGRHREAPPLLATEVLGHFRHAPLSDTERAFIAYTAMHRWLVSRNAHLLLLKGWDKLEMDFPRACRFLQRIAVHDSTKYGIEQAPGYLLLDKAKLNPGVPLTAYEQTVLDKAIKAHLRDESNHHLDTWHWFDLTTDYEWLSFLEIACDLQAMSMQQGEASFRQYLKEKWAPKHGGKFSDLAWYNFSHLMEMCLQIFEANPLEGEPWRAGQ